MTTVEQIQRQIGTLKHECTSWHTLLYMITKDVDRREQFHQVRFLMIDEKRFSSTRRG
ncbi:hypothetical protein IC582_019853 [Cucumis melo]